MKRTMMLFVVVFSMAGLAGTAAAQAGAPAPQILHITGGEETFKGKASDDQFPVEIVVKARGDEHVLTATGSGVRKKMVFKVYEAISYASLGVDLEADPYGALIGGDFPKRIVMDFLRDVDGGKIRGAYEDGFQKTIAEGDLTPALQAAIDTFLGHFGEPGVKKGQTIELTWMPGMGLYSVVAGQPYAPIDNPALATALWAIWFGPEPVSDDLRRDMVRFVGGGE